LDAKKAIATGRDPETLGLLRADVGAENPGRLARTSWWSGGDAPLGTKIYEKYQ
jgi:hypothetical protein